MAHLTIGLRAFTVALAIIATVGPASSQPGPDTAGDSIQTARDLGRPDQGMGWIKEWIGLGDLSDYYRLDISVSGELWASIGFMEADADLFLYTSNGELIDSSEVRGDWSESITADVPAGTYYIEVSRWSGDTSYVLNYQLMPETLVVEIPGRLEFVGQEAGGIVVEISDTLEFVGQDERDIVAEVPENVDLAVWEGVWETGWGAFVIEQLDREVTITPLPGEFLDRNGGTMDVTSATSEVIVGTYYISRPDYRGTFTFTLNPDHRTFDGTIAGDRARTLNGTRVE